jgi:rubrerythrin
VEPLPSHTQYVRYNRGEMPEPTKPTPPTLPTPPKTPDPASDNVMCERCGAEMFRMHAVWRCPACGYKTDCCGW